MYEELSNDEAREVWDKFVPVKRYLGDSFDNRIALAKHLGYLPLFLYDGKNFLPLWYEKDNDFFALFGGCWISHNYLTFSKESLNDPSVPENVYLDMLTQSFDGCIPSLCPDFFVNTAPLRTFDDYMERFSGKRSKVWRYDFRNFPEHTMQVELDKKKAYDRLIELNMASFGEQSDFANPDYRKVYDMFYEYSTSSFFSIRDKSGEVISTSMFVRTGTVLEAPAVAKAFNCNNIGKVALKEEVEMCIHQGITELNYFPTYSRWKVEYRLDVRPLWRYKKGNIPDLVEHTNCEITMADRKVLQERKQL